MAAYVRDDVALRRTWWIDHQTRWPRTERPGIHPARSTLVLSAGNAQILGAHNLPLHTQNTREGQLEIVHAVELVMNPWKRPRIRERVPDTQAMRDRPRMLLWDDNAPAGSRGLGSTYLAPRIGGHRHGRHIDNGCGRRMPVDHVDYVTHAGGVRMTTDHPWGACVIHLEPKTVRWSL
jgi:hypothetical protein